MNFKEFETANKEIAKRFASLDDAKWGPEDCGDPTDAYSDGYDDGNILFARKILEKAFDDDSFRNELENICYEYRKDDNDEDIDEDNCSDRYFEGIHDSILSLAKTHLAKI